MPGTSLCTVRAAAIAHSRNHRNNPAEPHRHIGERQHHMPDRHIAWIARLTQACPLLVAGILRPTALQIVPGRPWPWRHPNRILDLTSWQRRTGSAVTSVIAKHWAFPRHQQLLRTHSRHKPHTMECACHLQPAHQRHPPDRTRSTPSLTCVPPVLHGPHAGLAAIS